MVASQRKVGRVFGKICILLKKSLALRHRAGRVGWGIAGSRVSRVKQSESAESSVEDCLIGVSAAPTFALPPVPFCQTPTEQRKMQMRDQTNWKNLRGLTTHIYD